MDCTFVEKIGENWYDLHLKYDASHIEQFIVACSGKVNWRPDFIMGLEFVVLVAAVLISAMWMIGKIR